MLCWDVEIIKTVCLGSEGFFSGWTLKLNTSDPLLAALMETRHCFPAPQQKGQLRGPGKNVNVGLMVLCLRDAGGVWRRETLRACLLFFCFFFFLMSHLCNKE